MLTLGGGGLYYCSHSGAVVALDPWSGQYLWAARYPARSPRTDEVSLSSRDLAPCIYSDNRLFLAPRDVDRILCLDAATGRLLWQREGIEVVHLLGVTRGRVYFTTPGGLRCIDSGAPEGDSPRKTWLQPAQGTLPGLGRGLLAGGWLLWPTQDPKLPLRGVTLAEGEQERFAIEKKAPLEPEFLEPTMLRAILPGNMAFGQDCLAVAGLDKLAVYVPQKSFLKDRAKDVHQTQATALVLYQLAMAQADAGLKADATKNLERLVDTAATADWKGLSRQRLAELKGERTAFKDIPYVKVEIPTTLASNKMASGDLRLPLQKTMEIAAKQNSPPTAPPKFSLHNSEPQAHADPFFPANFRRNARHIFFMMDQRLLVAQNPSSQQTAWTFWLPGGRIMPLDDGGWFYPHYHAGDRYVLLQTTAGKTLILDSTTGKAAVVLRPRGPPWPHDPLALDDQRVLLSEEAGKVSLVDIGGRKVVWTFAPTRYTSLTGALRKFFGTKTNYWYWCREISVRNWCVSALRLELYFGPFRFCRRNSMSKPPRQITPPSFSPAAKRCRPVLSATASCYGKSRCPRVPAKTGSFKGPARRLLAYPLQEKRERAVLLIDPQTGQWMQRLRVPEGIGQMKVAVKDEKLLVTVNDKAWIFEQIK